MACTTRDQGQEPARKEVGTEPAPAGKKPKPSGEAPVKPATPGEEDLHDCREPRAAQDDGERKSVACGADQPLTSVEALAQKNALAKLDKEPKKKANTKRVNNREREADASLSKVLTLSLNDNQ